MVKSISSLYPDSIKGATIKTFNRIYKVFELTYN